MSAPPAAISFREALRFWWKLGFISFGGPAGQIAIMHRELVERFRWISERRFLHALNYCMVLPGPEAQQLAAIVRGADTSRLDLTPQSAGLHALSLGLSHCHADDHEMLRHGLVMYDALYAWCRHCRK